MNNKPQYENLSRSFALKNFYQNQSVNVIETIEQLKFLSKYTNQKGLYIVDNRYKEFSEIGLHYYNFKTIIKLLRDFLPLNNENLEPYLTNKDKKYYSSLSVKICYSKDYKLFLEKA
jgi:hypothetical protein